jgi:hypothetical protein
VKETATVGTLYGGSLFGSFLPLDTNSNVIVVAPDGDPNQGLVIVAVLHSASHKPPVVDDPAKEVMFCTKPEVGYTLTTDGGGPIKVLSKGSGNVTVKSQDGNLLLQEGNQAYVRGDDFASAVNQYTEATGTIISLIVSAIGASGAFAAAVASVLPPVAAAATTYQAAVGAVASGLSAYIQAKTRFVAARNEYLSRTLKGS